jgi:hypothetical protein
MKKNRQKLIWHTAHVLYRSDIRSQRPRRMHTFEEVYFLVSGLTLLEAREKAEKLAKQKQHSYKNVYGEHVSWKLVRFVGLQEMIDQKLVDGAEVHHQFFRGLKTRASSWQGTSNK